MAYKLEEFLHEQYRHHNPGKNGLIRVDDFNDNDVRQVFCHMFVIVTGAAEFELQLHKFPSTPITAGLIEGKGGSVIGRYDPVAQVTLVVRDGKFVRDLAKAIKRTVGRGAHYDNRNWKWVCRRTGASLDRLATNLWGYRSLCAKEKQEKRSKVNFDQCSWVC